MSLSPQQDWPLISVVINTYNDLVHLKKAVKSCSFQTYKNLQIIINDNCSTDERVYQEYKKLMQTDDRITLHKNYRHEHVLHSYHTVMQEVRGEYVVFLSVKDFLDSDYVRHVYFYMRYSDADIVVNKFTRKIGNLFLFDKKYSFLKKQYTGEETKHFFFDSLGISNEQNLILNKLYKTTLLKQALEQVKNLNIDEIQEAILVDLIVNLYVFNLSNKVAVDWDFMGYHCGFVHLMTLTKNTQKIPPFLNHSYLAFSTIQKNFLTSNTSEQEIHNFYWFILNFYAQFMNLNDLTTNSLDLTKILQILNLPENKTQEIKWILNHVNNNWLIPHTFKKKILTRKIKDIVQIGKKLTFSLTNGLFQIVSWQDETMRNVGEFYAASYPIIDCLGAALFLNKEVSVAYDPEYSLSAKLMEKLLDIVKKWGLDTNLVRFYPAFGSVVDEFNVLLDQWRINDYSINTVWNQSWTKKFIYQIFLKNKKDIQITKILFSVACLVTDNHSIYLRKSLFNYSFSFFYCFFVALAIELCEKSDLQNEIGKFMFDIFKEEKRIELNPFFNVNLKIAKKAGDKLIQIIKAKFTFLLNKEYAAFLYDAFFNNLANWSESQFVIPDACYIGHEPYEVFKEWKKYTRALKNKKRNKFQS